MANTKSVAIRVKNGSGIIYMVEDIILTAIGNNSRVIRIHSYKVAGKAYCRIFEIGEAVKTGTKVSYYEINQMAAIVARLKSLANVSISEHRRLQSGIIKFQLRPESARCMEIAFACFPSLDGNDEEVVMSL